jgi:CBS domain-containing protein
MKAQDIMTRDPRCVTADASVRDAAQLMKTEDVGIVPVVGDARHLVGVITDRDIALRCVADGMGTNCRVSDAMSAGQLSTVGPDEDVDKVMDLMQREQVRRIPVVDERGGLLGIIAQADVVRKAHDDLKAEETVERISEPGR